MIFLITAFFKVANDITKFAFMVGGRAFPYLVCREVSYAERKHSLLLTLSTAHTGSLLIATFYLSATPIPIVFRLLTPSS